MVNKEKRTLGEILSNLNDKQQQTIRNLRSLIRSIIPESEEIIRRGNITFRVSGKDFVWLKQASDHVDVEFAMGAALDSDLLRNHGIQEKNESVRHIEVRHYEQHAPELTRLLKDAARIGV
jgi:hypothetical protein